MATGRVTRVRSVAGAAASSTSVFVTATLTAAGVVGKVSGASLASTATQTAGGVKAGSTGAAGTFTATLTAGGFVSISSSATLAATASTTAAGGSVTNVNGAASLGATVTRTAAGLIGTAEGAILPVVFTTTATGSVSLSGTAALTAFVTTSTTSTRTFDRSGWRDIDVTFAVLESPHHFTVRESPWHFTLEAPVQMDRDLPDYLPLTAVNDDGRTLDMDPPFVALAPFNERPDPEAYVQSEWVGPVDSTRRFRVLIGPDVGVLNPGPGSWRVWVKLFDSPTIPGGQVGTLKIN